MKMNEFDMAHFSASQVLPAYRPARGWREAIAALKAALERAWAGLYASPPRRLPPLV